MTTHPPILRNSVLATPITLGVAAVFGLATGSPSASRAAELAVAAAVSSGVVLLNLWVLSVLVPPMIRAIARQEAPLLWSSALVAKFILLFVTYYLLFQFLPPFGLGLGFISLMVGTLITGIELAWQDNARVEEA